MPAWNGPSYAGETMTFADAGCVRLGSSKMLLGFATSGTSGVPVGDGLGDGPPSTVAWMRTGTLTL